MFFFTLVISLPLLDLLWWRWADSKLRALRHARRWRIAMAVFVVFQLASYFAFLLTRVAEITVNTPKPVLAAVYLWHLFILPMTMGIVVVATEVQVVVRWIWQKRKKLLTDVAPASPDPVEAAGTRHPRAWETVDGVLPKTTRREVLLAGLTAVPPLVTMATVPYGLAQLNTFRIRQFRVNLPTLPPSLDGITITHVSDIHVGRFTNGRVLDAIVDRVNALKADLVLYTGDLIDYSLADLSAGIGVLKRLDPRHGLFMCEGNHDLFQDRDEFEDRVKASGVPLLLNEADTATLRGETIQILGLKWGWGTAANRSAGVHARPYGGVEDNMQELLPLQNPDAFRILLAHHPHAFDRAAGAGIPLTLAGHTHGGQLMLTHNIGAGPLMFKYWSGLYQRGDSSLVVSNGIGNWFPLRINAPAEVVHITLRSGRGVV